MLISGKSWTSPSPEAHEMRSWHGVCAAWGKGRTADWQRLFKLFLLDPFTLIYVEYGFFQPNTAIRDWPHGGTVFGSRCIERTEALLTVSSQKVAGFCCLFRGTPVFMFAVTHGVLQLRSDLLLKARSILPMLTATNQNSLWNSMKNLLLLLVFFSHFPNVLQSFASTRRTQKLSLYRTCENSVAFMLNRCICGQSWAWSGSVHIQLHKPRLNRKVTVFLGVGLQDNPLIGREWVQKDFASHNNCVMCHLTLQRHLVIYFIPFFP